MPDDNFNMNSWMNIPGVIPTNSMAGMTQPFAAPMPQKTPEPMPCKVVYPEVFYRLQPYIVMVCDEMDTFGSEMPSQVMIEQMTDSIYDDVCRMYPDLADYAKEKGETIPTVEMYGMDSDHDHDHDHDFDRDDFFRRRFRRRGIFRDLIDILLLNEFFNRRRRRFF